MLAKHFLIKSSIDEILLKIMFIRRNILGNEVLIISS